MRYYTRESSSFIQFITLCVFALFIFLTIYEQEGWLLIISIISALLYINNHPIFVEITDSEIVMYGFSIFKKKFSITKIESITLSNKKIIRVAPSNIIEIFNLELTVRLGSKDYNFALSPKSKSNTGLMDELKRLSKNNHFTVYDET